MKCFRVFTFSMAAILAATCSQLLRAAEPDTPSVPVLVELFTSEGCSSCPPADTLLAKLDQLQPVSGATLIVLSEHVDYWDHDGWLDPFSSADYTARQKEYGFRMNVPDVYTPQMVVDGHAQCNGSDPQKALHAIEEAAKDEKVPVTISDAKVENNVLTLHVKVSALPASIPAKSANVLLAVADDHDQTHVGSGENAGKTLDNVAVVRTLMKAGKVDRKGDFSQDLKVRVKGDPKNLRVAVIVQEMPAGRVWGLAATKLQ
jgi:hypothetical protein